MEISTRHLARSKPAVRGWLEPAEASENQFNLV